MIQMLLVFVGSVGSPIGVSLCTHFRAFLPPTPSPPQKKQRAHLLKLRNTRCIAKSLPHHHRVNKEGQFLSFFAQTSGRNLRI